jgi:transcriptional regulator with XRE-family HTH domain
VKLGELLKMAREISGKTLRDLEGETAISNALLSQIETGHVKQPGFQNVVKIARALNVKLDTLAEHSVTDLKKVLRDLKATK